ncbi:Tungsten-containing aldehyde:ferredoxin oxidoreductase (EC [Olavius sp. associated proteobacterium Delta 1]|nr:Tungsten-containing aldehyde:ferredoxin oxidoreductase (EC [Olavius sp. associated proteobacterium Delta 1]
MDKILKVNTRTNDIRWQACSADALRLGGRSLIAHLALMEIDPNCDPLGHRNKFILAAGLLGDTNVTTAGRYSVGGKSPLTGGVKEASVGGSAGRRMARLGLRAVVLEDVPDNPQTKILVVSKDKAEIITAPEYKNLAVSASLHRLRDQFGEDAGAICVGPAGEMTMAGAGVATTDKTGVQIRFAGRGGMGAVMGSKGIKAIVFDDTGASPAEFYDRKALNAANKKLVQLLMDDPKTENRHNYGTPAVLAVCNALGILPTRNFSEGQFDQVDAISGETIAELIDQRGGMGRKGQPCIEGCVIQCSNVFPDPEGQATVASLQYENIALLGSNCGISDIDAIAELNSLCNEVGLDAIETGAAIGVAMEAGVIPFGDAHGAKDLIRQALQGTPLGRVIGNGVVITGKVFGVRRVPAVRGQAIPAYDPRSLKGIGVTYVTSPMGADHTAGNALELASSMDPRSPEGQVEASRQLQLRAAILDSLGVCLFIRPAFVKKPDLFAELLNARHAFNLTFEDVQQMGVQCLATERAFNKKAGLNTERCDVPEFMRYEPLPPYNTVFDISNAEMKKIWTVEPIQNQF